MKNISNILVIIDPMLDDQQPALMRGLELAEITGATLHTLLVSYQNIHEADYVLSQNIRDEIQTNTLQQQSNWLDSIINPIKKRLPELSINTTVRWHHRLYEAIIQEAVHLSADLVIKSTHIHSVVKRVFFTPTDWSLLRKCPTPVMLVKSGKPWHNGKILAAIDAASQDYNHVILNEAIIESTTHIAQLLHAETYVVNACPTAPNILPLVAETVSVAEIQKSILSSHQERTIKLVEKYNIPEKNVSIEEGTAEYVVTTTAERLNVDLVVLGTIARTGIPGVLIGNTAERVLESLNVDILALKPSDYISPLTIEK